jgi:hypothetical protein
MVLRRRLLRYDSNLFVRGAHFQLDTAETRTSLVKSLLDSRLYEFEDGHHYFKELLAHS